MVRHVRKREGSAKVSVMEKAGGASRKRKLVLRESELSVSSSPTQLKTQRTGEVRPASSLGNSTCESGSSDHVLVSCCSSTAAEAEGSTKFADLKLQRRMNIVPRALITSASLENEATVEFSVTTAGDLEDFRDSFVRGGKSGSGEAESTETNCSGCSAAEKLPNEAELEEFFAAAETNLRRQFIDKYNYDIRKDEWLEEGRYEWVQVQQKKQWRGRKPKDSSSDH